MWRREIVCEEGGRYFNRVMIRHRYIFAIKDKLFDQESIRVNFGSFFRGGLIRKLFKKFLKS